MKSHEGHIVCVLFLQLSFHICFDFFLWFLATAHRWIQPPLLRYIFDFSWLARLFPLSYVPLFFAAHAERVNGTWFNHDRETAFGVADFSDRKRATRRRCVMFSYSVIGAFLSPIIRNAAMLKMAKAFIMRLDCVLDSLFSPLRMDGNGDGCFGMEWDTGKRR